MDTKLMITHNTHNGDFRVTKDMVVDGMLIKEKMPRKIIGNFNCAEHGLISLKGSPYNISGSYWCNDNKLTTLKGGPIIVGGAFSATNNMLTNLEGSPNLVGGNLWASNNSDTNNNFNIEISFIKSGNYKKNYWSELLIYVLKYKYELSSVYWPSGFLNENLEKSANRISKFNL